MWPEKSSPRHDPDFISHLEEIRQRLLIALIFFFCTSVLSYLFAGQILDFLTLPLKRHQDVQLFFHKPYEAFLVHIKVSALTGFLLSLPVLLTQLWLFVAPGLYANEKRIIFWLVLVSVFLFLSGAAFAYLVVIPWGLHFLLEFQTESVRPFLGVGPYFSFLTGMVLALGLFFDFPVIVVGLIRLRVLRTSVLKRSRKIVIVAIFVLAAILTPSPDPVSQLLMAVPLLLLFEISMLVGRLIERDRS